MKITWVVRSFLDYRVPVYEALDNLCGHELTVIYYKDTAPARCQERSSINIYANISFPAIAAIFVNINSCPVLGSHWSFVTDSILIIMAATFINFTGVSRGDRRTINEMMNSNRRKI